MDMEESSQLLSKQIETFIAARLATKLEDLDKAAEKKYKEVFSDELAQIEETLVDKRAQLLKKYQLNNWLTDAAKKAGQINMVTHAPKYTHSDTKSMGVLLQEKDKEAYAQHNQYLCSLSLTDLIVDVVGNAAVLDVASLMRLKFDGVSLFDEIATGDSPALAALATSKDQLAEWMHGFREVLRSKELKSGQLSKQLYFPSGMDGYHLVSPLYASALSQALHEKLTHSFYSEPAKAARQARKAEKFSTDDAVTYPNIALQSFGGTKPQNISQFNTNRHGKGFLLSSQPPRWQKQLAPPAQGKNSFWREYDRRAWKTAKFLKSYLEKIFDQTKTIERRDFRAELVDELVDTLLIYAAEVQNLKEKAGWSLNSKLSKAEQLWLDPYRSEIDEAFRAERERNDWQAEIAKQFAAWLNHKISYKSDKLYTDDTTFKVWGKLLERKLALLKEDLEVGV
jgi:CRISPR-associated protein Csy1